MKRSRLMGADAILEPCRAACLTITLVLAGCNLLTPDASVGSKYVKTLSLAAGAGGVLEVSDDDCRELAGTRLKVDPGTFAEATTITLTLERRDIVEPPNTALGVVANFGPQGGVPLQPIAITLPFRTDDTAAPRDLYVERVDDASGRVHVQDVTVDPSLGRLSFTTSDLGRFQAGADGCDASNPCPPDQTCAANGRCRSLCDGVTCAASETCVHGICQSRCADTCDSAPAVCRVSPGRCDPVTLGCVYERAPSGTRCQEPSTCIAAGRCDAVGACQGSSTCNAHQHCDGAGGCPCDADYIDCDGLSSNGCEFNGTVCPCDPETDAMFCARAARSCGAFTGTDNCQQSRSVDCGSCAGACERCDDGTGQCVASCCAESDDAFCARLGQQCGPLTAPDNCANVRTVNCAGCFEPDHCDAHTSRCYPCTLESDEDFCYRLVKACGSVTETDLCGQTRFVASCGICGGGVPCTPDNQCPARPGNESCAHPTTLRITAPGSFGTTSVIDYAFDDAHATCVPAGGSDVVYQLLLQTAGTVSVDIELTAATWEPAFYLRTACGSAASEIACVVGSGGVASLTNLQLSPGTYFVWVDSLLPRQIGIFHLNVTTH